MTVAAVRHWNTYVNDGYSMMLEERLGNSCRLSVLDWIVAPTVAGRCGSRPWKRLGPPIVRTVFVHPSGGWIPVFDKSTGGHTAAVVEWYGLVATPFAGNRLVPFGASVVPVFPDAGTHPDGVAVHTPFGRIARFPKGISSDKKGQIALMGDIASWVPGTRSSMARHLFGLLMPHAKDDLGAAVRKAKSRLPRFRPHRDLRSPCAHFVSWVLGPAIRASSGRCPAI